jgi:IMP dehydrogenase/GMP reductase
MSSLTDPAPGGGRCSQSRQEALTFDDVLLLPGYSEVVATDVSLAAA